jgi:hypothetical protein
VPAWLTYHLERIVRSDRKTKPVRIRGCRRRLLIGVGVLAGLLIVAALAGL